MPLSNAGNFKLRHYPINEKIYPPRFLGAVEHEQMEHQAGVDHATLSSARERVPELISVNTYETSKV
jgi:hypothetical protein